jgi:hypothetical protein
MSFYWIYDISNGLFIILCTVFFIFMAIAGLFILRRFITKTVIPQAHNDVVSYFMAGMNAIYGITLGLLAVGAWEKFAEVQRDVQQEAAVLSALYQDVSMIPSPLGDTLKAELKEYCRFTVYDAWPQQRQGKRPKGGTARITKFQNSLVSFDPKTKGLEIVLDKSFDQVNQLVIARNLRLQGVEAGLPAAVWYIILFGGLLNLIINWFFVTDRFRVHILMNVLFSALLGSLIALVAAMDNPFRGDFSVSPAPFESVYEHMSRK